MKILGKRPRTPLQLEAARQNGKKAHLGTRADQTPNWKGGLIRAKENRLFVYTFDDRRYCRFSRLVVENQIGRRLTDEEVVHHEDRDPTNDEVSNLICFSTQSAHIRWHRNPMTVKQEEIVFDGRMVLTQEV